MGLNFLDDALSQEYVWSVKSLFQESEIFLSAFFNSQDLSLVSCNDYFIKKFHVQKRHMNKMTINNLFYIEREKNITPYLNSTGEKPVSMILYTYQEREPIECYFFANEDAEKILMYAHTRNSNDISVLEKMSSFTTSIAQLSRELKKKNNELDMMLQKQSGHAQMGEMISMIAHQWRQPLSSITASAMDLYVASELESYDLTNPDEAKAYQDNVNENIAYITTMVQNLSTTIDDFRNFYKPNKESNSVSFKTVYEKTLVIIEASLRNKNIELVRVDNSQESITLYESEMMQVILNILKNSQDNFLEKKVKSPKITITCDRNTLKICDNGGGIPENILEKIFEPYFSTKDQKNGTGLGLYMSKTIVEEHHKGTLDAYNQDEGVCFEINI